MKINKLSAIVIAAVLSTTASVANAKAMICGYSDHIHLSQKTLVSPFITGTITADGAATGVQTSGSSFDIRDNQQDPNSCNYNSTGTVHVTYALNSSDYCTMNIVDGPGQDNPDDNKLGSVQCYGKLAYLGMSYDGFMTYSYSMLFATK